MLKRRERRSICKVLWPEAKGEPHNGEKEEGGLVQVRTADHLDWDSIIMAASDTGLKGSNETPRTLRREDLQ